jgi:UDP:flavonoid glycosyltransferase YjiC (YdhE family)
MQFSGDGLDTGVRVLGDGRLDIRINEHKPSIAGLLHLQRTPIPSELEDAEETDGAARVPAEDGKYFPLNLNIVIQVIGSRGDIQPFVALGKELKAHGHRVRLATHLAFREFILDADLEFFNIGGDPAELMAFMVKNPGLLPSMNTIRSGAIQKRRREMKEMVDGCWRSCFEMGDGTHLHQIKEDPWSDVVDYRRRPFVADVIIANPPSLAHIHCAQRLGIPLHIIFTMPWSPTQSFPHPLAVLHQQDSCKPTVANFVSYAIVDMMIWEGLGDIVNKYRRNVLSLDSLDGITAPSLIHKLQIPCSYLWSPAVLPKPQDWGDYIDICGFSFLPSKPDYTPPDEIAQFLEAGSTPIYVGFGSIVVDDQIRLTKVVFEAIQKSGQRAIVSKGWGNLGVDEVDVPENILIIGSCPHDWLFRQVSCVIHHGGAGTTAAGLALGRPTIIVPFFGDQQFWGDIVARAGAGPSPIPHKRLTADGLSDAIEFALRDSTLQKAREIAKKMENESGVRDGVRSFHRQLDLRTLRCAICPSRPAVWHLKHTNLGFSAFAAAVLVETGKLKPEDLVLNRPKEYDTHRDPVGPLSASAQVLFGAIANFVTGIAEVPTDMVGDIVAAGRAIGHSREHLDIQHKWRHRKCKGANSNSQSDGSIETEESAHQDERAQSSRPNNRSDPDESLPDEDSEDEEMISDSSETRSTDIVPDQSMDRRRSLQLEKSQTMSSQFAPSKPHTVLSEAANLGGKMSKKFVNLLIWLPTDLTLSLSKGFHNAPKLYHDPMVKSTPTVHDVRSGLRAAGKEFYDGFYYGVTGLVTQPRYGYKKKGTKGMIKGVGKGLGGVFFKPPAGLWGLAGYPLSGLRRKLLDSLGKSSEGQIILSRIAQGHEEMCASSADERSEVVRKWMIIEESLKQTKRTSRRCHSRPQHHAPHIPQLVTPA